MSGIGSASDWRCTLGIEKPSVGGTCPSLTSGETVGNLACAGGRLQTKNSPDSSVGSVKSASQQALAAKCTVATLNSMRHGKRILSQNLDPISYSSRTAFPVVPLVAGIILEPV